MRHRIARLAAVMVMIVLGAAPPARAAEVSVHETPGVNENLATLSFQALPGEENEVTILASAIGDRLDLTVYDLGASLSPGAGCFSADDGGAIVKCAMHAPKFSDFEPCGKGCARPIPGTAWRDILAVDLGDGDNSFNSGSIREINGLTVTVNITSGGGEDRIFLGSGEDRIDSGAGRDEVHSGGGFDRISASATADGADTYVSGPSLDKISYATRSAPVYLASSVAGGAGEGDGLYGLFHVVGGAADDLLEGGPGNLILEGGPGDDHLSGTAERSNLYGGAGDDRLATTGAPGDSFNHLVGEEGNDTYLGGPGTDLIRESELHSNWGGRPESGLNPGPSGGDDTAFGGGGRDIFELRAGEDVAYGEGGNDSLHGGMAADMLVAGPGADQLIGGSGFDALFGGAGNDRLFSGRWKWNTASKAKTFPFPPVGDDGRDRAGCGSGRDLAFANPWDRLHACEDVRLRPRP